MVSKEFLPKLLMDFVRIKPTLPARHFVMSFLNAGRCFVFLPVAVSANTLAFFPNGKDVILFV